MFQIGSPDATYHEMRGVCLELMNCLEFVKPGFGARQAQTGGLLHETKFSIDVLELVGVTQSVPNSP